MTKNESNGRRIGAVTGRAQSQSPKAGLWTRRNANSGQFTELKRTGGAFKGIRREG